VPVPDFLSPCYGHTSSPVIESEVKALSSARLGSYTSPGGGAGLNLLLTSRLVWEDSLAGGCVAA
jgi:hypothetical protein